MNCDVKKKREKFKKNSTLKKNRENALRKSKNLKVKRKKWNLASLSLREDPWRCQSCRKGSAFVQGRQEPSSKTSTPTSSCHFWGATQTNIPGILQPPKRNCNEVILNSCQFSRVRYDGIHLSTGEELAKKADVCFLAITDIEFDTVVGALLHREEPAVPWPGPKEALLSDTKGTRSTWWHNRWGNAPWGPMALPGTFLPWQNRAVSFFKIGGAAARLEIGTISVLCRGPDGVVLHGKTGSFLGVQ